MVNYSPKNYGTLHLLGKTTSPKSLSPKKPTSVSSQMQNSAGRISASIDF
jgi:hypothetical protein